MTPLPLLLRDATYYWLWSTSCDTGYGIQLLICELLPCVLPKIKVTATSYSTGQILRHSQRHTRIPTTHQQRYHYIFGLLLRCTHDIFFLYSSTLHISSSVHIAHITCWCVHILIRTSIGLELRTIHSDTPKYQHPINNDIVTSSDAFCFAHIIYSPCIHQLYTLAVVYT